MFDAMLNWLKREKKDAEIQGVKILTTRRRKGRNRPNPLASINKRTKKLGCKGAFGKPKPIPTGTCIEPERNFSKSPDREWLENATKKDVYRRVYRNGGPILLERKMA